MKDKWIKFMEQAPRKKTRVFTVMSKYSDIELGTIKWYPQWRHYCFFPTDADFTIYSDRCLITIADFITKLNLKHKEVKSGCDANDDGIPPNNELLGILPKKL